MNDSETQQYNSVLSSPELQICSGELNCPLARPMNLVKDKPLGCMVILSAQNRGMGINNPVVIIPEKSPTIPDVQKAVDKSDEVLLNLTATEYRKSIPEKCPKFVKITEVRVRKTPMVQ